MPKNKDYFGFSVVLTHGEEARPVVARYETKVGSNFNAERVLAEAEAFIKAEGVFVEKTGNRIRISAWKSTLGDGLAEYLNKLHPELDFVRLQGVPVVQPSFVILHEVSDSS